MWLCSDWLWPPHVPFQRFFPLLLPSPSLETSAPRCGLCLATPTKYRVGAAFSLSPQQHCREGFSDTLGSSPFAAGAGKEKKITVTPPPGVKGQMGFPSRASSQGRRTGTYDKKIFRTVQKSVQFLEYSGGFWEEFCLLLNISVYPHKSWQNIYFPCNFFTWYLATVFGICWFSLFGRTKVNNYIINMLSL